MGMRVGDILYETARRWPFRDAVVYGDASYTYAAWNDRINGLAAGLAGLGLKKGDRVATFAYNSEALMAIAMACQKGGLVYTPINFRLASEELGYILEHCSPTALFFDAELVSTVAAAARGIEHLIVHGDGRTLGFGTIDFDSLILLGAGEPEVAIEESDPSVLMYTSGTTGLPKGALLDHRSQWINTLLCAYELGLRGDDRTLHMAPMYHVAAYHVMFLPHVFAGATNVILRKFSPAPAFLALEEYGVTTVLGVPTQFDQMQSFAAAGGSRGTALRLAVTTGSLISPRTQRWVREQLTNNLVCVYGLTETTSLLTILHSEEWDRRPDGCIGRALLGVQARVLDPREPIDLNRELSDGQPGVLVASTPKSMVGYVNNPVKTAEMIREGWVVTGDMVTRDSDGYFYLVDRVDDMIISGAENIYPQEVERVLLQHPGIADCAVIGVPDPTWGQAIKAFVVRKSCDLTAEALTEFCVSGRLARYKKPRIIEFIDEIPRNPSGKILRKVLRVRGSESAPDKVIDRAE